MDCSTRLPCPLLSPWVCSNSRPLSRWCRPTITLSVAPSPPALSISQHGGLFWRASCLHQVAKVLERQLQHQSFQWIFRVISFKIDWFCLLSVQGTFKSLLQHHSSKTSVLWHSDFFTVQLSCSYMPTGKTIALTIQTFVSKMVSLLFNMLSRSVLALLSLETNLY